MWLTEHIAGAGAGLALVLSVLIRFVPRPGRAKDVDRSPAMMGYLAGRSRRAVITALAMLQVRGAVRVAGRGMVKHAEGKFSHEDRFLVAVYAAIYKPNGPRAIAARPQVRRAMRELRESLVAARLRLPTGRWLFSRSLSCVVPVLAGIQLHESGDAASVVLAVVLCPLFVAFVSLGGRTMAGRLAIAGLRSEYRVSKVDVTDARGVGYAVAVRGKDALRAIMPRFAKDGGLLDGGSVARYLGDGSIEPSAGTYLAQ
ncbi:MAG TPA: TIGR04222 domain-containing membrane protein [Pseudonocardiaceae bacterium]|jgi:uncharacterized protein (TIGR04222 family)|nr:TIGR04222 domain-containing membrane protein [Pseudonocardiaceae bacterium]